MSEIFDSQDKPDVQDIRVDDLLEAAKQREIKPPSIKIKPKIDPAGQDLAAAKTQQLHDDTADIKIDVAGQELDAEQILLAAAALQQRMARDADGRHLDLNQAAQVMSLKKLRLKDGSLDFSKLTEDAIFDLDLPIVAKPFSNEDALDVDLKDKNYVARWVNVNPMRLGSMRSKGFVYLTEDDLASPLNIEVETDAQGHFRMHDVVAMRITKERYFAAMKAAHLRAMASVSSLGAHKAATSAANQYMERETGGEFVDFANRGKVKFYPVGSEKDAS